MINNTQYSTGGKVNVPLDPPSSFAASAGNAKVTLTWTDPPDKTSQPSGQTIATWSYTRIVRKTGSQPTGPHDGELVVSSSVRDQYATTGYVDTGLTNDTTYYYAAYAYNTDGVASEGAFASATPIAGTPLGNLAEGTLIKILENGSPVEFYLAKHSYEPGLNGQGRELVVRKGCFSQVPYDQTTGDIDINDYMRSSFTSACSSYVSNLSEFVQSKIGTTKFPYYIVEAALNISNHSWYYNYTNTTGTAAVFNPSATELGCTSNRSGDGTRLPNYRAILPSNVTSRTSAPSRGSYQWCFDGSWSMTSGTLAPNFLPCFTLPNDLLVDQNLNLIES